MSLTKHLAGFFAALTEKKVSASCLERAIAILACSTPAHAPHTAKALELSLPHGFDDDFFERGKRLACRLAYGTVRLGYPKPGSWPEIPRCITDIAAHFRRVRNELIACGAHAEVVVPDTFRDRLLAYLFSLHAVRNMLQPEGVPPALSGALTEWLIVAGADDSGLVERLASKQARDRPAADRYVLRNRIADAVEHGMDNPLELQTDEDALDKPLSECSPFELALALARVKAFGEVVVDLDAPPRFLGALTRNPYFAAKASTIVGEVADALNI